MSEGNGDEVPVYSLDGIAEKFVESFVRTRSWELRYANVIEQISLLCDVLDERVEELRLHKIDDSSLTVVEKIRLLFLILLRLFPTICTTLMYVGAGQALSNYDDSHGRVDEYLDFSMERLHKMIEGVMGEYLAVIRSRHGLDSYGCGVMADDKLKRYLVCGRWPQTDEC